MSHLTQSNREIAVPIQECIHMLLRTGMREEVWLRGGTSTSSSAAQCAHKIQLIFLFLPQLTPQGLFRLAAAASVVKRLKTCLDQGAVDHSEFSMDPHAVAGNHQCGRCAATLPA